MIVNMRTCVWCLVVTLVGVSAWPTMLPAAELQSGVAKLFELGQKNTPPAVAAARAQYERLQAAAPQDPRLDYAYGLVLLNQHRYADALALIDNYAQVNGDDPRLVQLRLWGMTQARRYADVLEQALALAKRFPPKPAPGDNHLETARFLGKLFGYLESTRPSGLDPELKTLRTNELLALLGDAYLPAFDEGRHQVAQQFAKLDQQRQAIQQSRELANDQQRDEVFDALKQNEAQATLDGQKADASREQLRDAQRALGVVRIELSNLMQTRTRLGAQIFAVQAQLTEVQTTMQNTIVDPSVRDPNRQGQIVTTTRNSIRLEDALRAQSLALTLAVLNRQAVEMDKRILMLRSEAAGAIKQGQQGSQTLDESRTAVLRAERRAENLHKQARRLERRRSATSAVLTAEMKRLATYLPFPYEDEAKRVLGWFAN